MKKKLLLLHGWDWRKYPRFEPAHQWENRSDLITRLGDAYELDFPTLPGFRTTEGLDRPAWDLDDYAAWVEERVRQARPDAIVGYSFGCAVAVHWAYRHRSHATPLALISPAISRRYEVRSRRWLSAASSFLRRLRLDATVDHLRTMYLRYWVRNPNIVHGTPFLVATYSNIVGVDLSEEFQDLLRDDNRKVVCVFGAEDTATPPELLFSRVPAAKEISILIPRGGHNIGGTHVPEIVAAIEQLVPTR